MATGRTCVAWPSFDAPLRVADKNARVRRDLGIQGAIVVMRYARILTGVELWERSVINYTLDNV
jgi:hypothetical protein